MVDPDLTPHETPVIEVAPPPLAELRGLRLLLPATPSPRELRALVQRAADAGVNALIARVYRRGTTLWLSDTAPSWRLPRARRWLGGRDVLGELAQACLEQGVRLCAWADLLPAMDRSRERRSPLARRHWKWRMRRFNGSPRPQGPERDLVYLCPAWPEVRIFLADVCCELAARYPIDAVWFEGLRYPVGAERPDGTFCFCPQCRARVREEIDLDLDKVPLDVNDEQYRAWIRWREEQLQALITALVSRLRKTRSELAVMAGVPAGATDDPTRRIGLMDWSEWTREGLLDLAAPMWFGSPGAATIDERLATIASDLTAVAPYGRLAPVIGRADMRVCADALLETARALPLSGHVWDAYPGRPTDEEWEIIRQAHGQTPALAPETDPLDSSRAVIGETLPLAGSDSPLGDFLDDLQGVLQTGYGQFSDNQMDKLLSDLTGHWRDVVEGRVRVERPERVERNLDWLQRQLVYLRSRQLLTRGL
jgi:uncharacterized lipoprotein YddW (UPF0748 family)